MILKADVSKTQISAGVRENLTTPIKSIFVSVIVQRNGTMFIQVSDMENCVDSIYRHKIYNIWGENMH